MKFYTDADKVTLVQSITSASTFISSIAGTIKKHILKAFPKDYFRYIYTDTSETFQEFNKTDAYNKVLHKIPYPTLSISPQLSIDQTVGGLKNILMSSPNFWLPRDIRRQYPCLLEEPDSKYAIYFTSDYITTNFRYKIVTDSFPQATEIGFYLKSRFNDETFKYLSNQTIEVEMPRSYVNAIAKMENLFGSDGVDSFTTAEDFDKLSSKIAQMGRRAKTIIPKHRSNNRKLSYYFEEKANLLTLFTDLNIPEGVIRDSSVNGEYEVEFRVQVSAWWPNAFIMVVNKNAYREIADIIQTGSTTDNQNAGSFYTTSIGTISLDRKSSIYFNDNNQETHVGINILHGVYQDENGWDDYYNKTEDGIYDGTTTVSLSKLIWG